MPRYLVLPKIGMNMEEGVISEWLVKPGDRVEKEQMVVRAETDKAIQDIFATDSGIVYKLLAQPGDVVPCQAKIAILVDEGEEYQDETEKETPSLQDSLPDKKQEKAPSERISVSDDKDRKRRGFRISPLARKTAKELGIREEEIRPAEEGKRIVRADVLRCQEEKSAAQKQCGNGEEGTFVPFSHKRKVIARRMLDSANSKPRVTLTASVNCEKLVEFREKLKTVRRVTYNEIIAKACASALKKYPEMNCIKEENGCRVMNSCNIGIAVDTEDGLLVPVLKNVETKGILELAEDFQVLVEKARSGQLGLDEMSGGTFSISNVGMFGVESFDPIVNAPECFILGVGCMKECVEIVRHEICIQTCMKLCLSFDHTVFDGAGAAKLLKEIKDLLEDPVLMIA